MVEPVPTATKNLEFLKSVWGLGTKEEQGYRTGPPGQAGGIHSWESVPGLHKRLKMRALVFYTILVPW